MRVLVVDDSSTMRRIIINTLGRCGYTDCLEAGTGREGLEKLATEAVDVVITDWDMPEMHGLDFVRAIRASQATRDIPVLMVATNAARDDIVEGLRAGVDSYVVKPFTPEVIRAKILASIRAEPAPVRASGGA